MIVWINGRYGGGKTTLVEELVRRRPDAVVLDPGYVGDWLRQTVAVPTDNVQDLRGWRDIVVASVLSVHRHHAQLLLVPMTLINPAYRDEVLGALRTAGVELLEVFLEVSAEELRRRINSRVLYTNDPERDADARNWCLSQIPEGVTAARPVGQSTMMLAATPASPSELALAVLERLDARSSKGVPVGRSRAAAPLRPVDPSAKRSPEGLAQTTKAAVRRTASALPTRLLVRWKRVCQSPAAAGPFGGLSVVS